MCDKGQEELETRYVWLNIKTGKFSNSWGKGIQDMVKPHLYHNTDPEWKLIEYTCLTDADFEFNRLMKIK